MRMRAKYVKIRIATPGDVAERWRKQYPDDRKNVHNALIELGENPTSEDVDKVIGNQSWTKFLCDGCSDYISKGVELGEYENKVYCETCLKEALHIFNS